MMDDNFFISLIAVCRILTKHNVKYFVVGGTAVALYGYFRMSLSTSGMLTEKPDLDFWYSPSYENYFRLLNAIEELGEDMSTFKNEIAPDPLKSFFKLNL